MGIGRRGLWSREPAWGSDSPFLPQGRHSRRKKEAMGIPCLCPHRPAGQMGYLVLTAVLQQREISPLRGGGGDILEAATSTRVPETVESGSWGLFHPHGHRPSPSPPLLPKHEHTSGAAGPRGQGGAGESEAAAPSAESRPAHKPPGPLVPGASSPRR